MTTPATVTILGVPIHRITMAQTLDCIEEFVIAGRRDGTTHQVATVNSDFVTNALADPPLIALLRQVDLALPDGMPIVWGARLLGEPMPERVTGADLVPALAARAAARGMSMYFFGASEGVAERAADIVRGANHGLTIGADSGTYVRDVRDTPQAALDAIRAARPDIVCVALGNPKQEWWIDAFRGQLGVPVLIGVGGTLDLIVGEKKRAPAWVGRLGLEWVVRAAQEPRRLIPRYARNAFVFLPRLALQCVRVRCARRRDHA
jgi:N-acetylglucosaminyldiphosphoundecaprenol N-acetyl-beta-D-mannosaminyltransferase